MANPTPQQQPLGLPTGLSPDALDTLTELASILSRLRTPATLPPAIGTGQTPLPASTPAPTSNPADGAAEISLKDVPTATDHLKHKLQRARAQIRTLPDMDRSTAEQEREMAELEARIRRQREVLGMLREKGLRFAAGEREGRDGEEAMDLE